MLKSVYVRDYMTTRLVSFKPETDIFEAIDVLLKNKISGAPVLNEDGDLVGVFSESDCLKSFLNAGYYEGQAGGGCVRDFMSSQIDSVSPMGDIIELAQTFIEKGRRRMPVVEEGKIVGQISRRDILRAVKDFAQNK